MKKWLKILVILLMVPIIMYGYRQWTRHDLRASVEEIRRQLRQQGFKTDLSDFNFTLSAEASTRADAIIATGQAVRTLHHTGLP